MLRLVLRVALLSPQESRVVRSTTTRSISSRPVAEVSSESSHSEHSRLLVSCRTPSLLTWYMLLFAGFHQSPTLRLCDSSLSIRWPCLPLAKCGCRPTTIACFALSRKQKEERRGESHQPRQISTWGTGTAAKTPELSCVMP